MTNWATNYRGKTEAAEAPEANQDRLTLRQWHRRQKRFMWQKKRQRRQRARLSSPHVGGKGGGHGLEVQGGKGRHVLRQPPVADGAIEFVHVGVQVGVKQQGGPACGQGLVRA